MQITIYIGIIDEYREYWVIILKSPKTDNDHSMLGFYSSFFIFYIKACFLQLHILRIEFDNGFIRREILKLFSIRAWCDCIFIKLSKPWFHMVFIKKLSMMIFFLANLPITLSMASFSSTPSLFSDKHWYTPVSDFCTSVTVNTWLFSAKMYFPRQYKQEWFMIYQSIKTCMFEILIYRICRPIE